MSSVVIAGDTSGSVTLQAPATAGSVVVTLPGTSGTMAVTGGSPTFTTLTATTGNITTVNSTTAATSNLTIGGTALGAGNASTMKNRLINGNFQVWQYGTSGGSGYSCADRWKLQAAGTTTFSQETSVIPAGSQYAIKWTTGASSSYGQLRQWMEQSNVIPLQGQTMTASALVRGNATLSGNLVFEIGYCTTTDSSSGSYTAVTITSQSGTVTSSGYTQITATFTVPSNALGLYIGIVPTVAQASGAIAYISQAQLELGSYTTGFDSRLYGAELALCQRYYWKFVNGNSSVSGLATYYNSTTLYTIIQYPVTMRSTPTTAISSGTSYYNFIRNGGNNAFNSLTLTSYTSNSSAELFNNTEASGTAGQSGWIRTQDANSSIAFTAEL